MKTSPLAQELNKTIKEQNSNIFDMLSDLGKELYFPKGIVAQGAEAKAKAKNYNATIGIATLNKKPMGLESVTKQFADPNGGQFLPYAPGAGKPDIRKKWQEGLFDKNPSLKGKSISMPIVTSGVTHGLSVISDMLADESTTVLMPEKYWENYDLIFGLRRKCEFELYNLFTANGSFDIDAFKAGVEKVKTRGKFITIFNFPNNPTGFAPSTDEVKQIASVLEATAKEGCKIIAVCDDAYFGLYYEDDTCEESLFGSIADLHENLLAFKVDGPTKELYVWGFRTGFLSFSTKSSNNEKLFGALEKKIMGIIRGTISNCSNPSQSIIYNAMSDPNFAGECAHNKGLLKARAQKVKQILDSGMGSKHWEVYPFNSGYFMCLKLKKLNAEAYRQHLLNNYGIGLIANGDSDIRVAFSSVNVEELDMLFELMAKAADEM